jgi:Ribbon-helix-helix protein, copG family
MSMPLDRRLQILIDEDRYRRISSLANERGVSVATVVREAIDRGLPRSAVGRRAAARRILDAPGMPVPGVDELKAELDALRGRHG